MLGAKATSYICAKTALSSSPAVMPRGPRNSSLRSRRGLTEAPWVARDAAYVRVVAAASA